MQLSSSNYQPTLFLRPFHKRAYSTAEYPRRLPMQELLVVASGPGLICSNTRAANVKIRYHSINDPPESTRSEVEVLNSQKIQY